MQKDFSSRPASADDKLASLGSSPAMRDLQASILRAAPTDASVFLVGESGVGKDRIAECIHALSARRNGPYIALYCGALSAGLSQAEGFGHEKDPVADTLARPLGYFEPGHIKPGHFEPGYFEHASGGTLFLDEITEMPVDMQGDLLRLLETGTDRRVGGIDVPRANVRIISASRRDPLQAVAEGRLREDLLHRLRVVPIRVPPLRERREDIAGLAQRMLDEFNQRHGTRKTMGPDMVDTLQACDWPGNVRELCNVVYRAYVMCDEVMQCEPLPGLDPAPPRPAADALAFEVGTPLSSVQRELIRATLALHQGDKPRAAATLGISLKTLYNRLNAYGLDAPADG